MERREAERGRDAPRPGTTAGRSGANVTKLQIAHYALPHDHATAIADSLHLLHEATGTAQYGERVSALIVKRPPIL